MGDLAVLTPEEKDIVTRALFKVGAWISHAEDEGGEGDDAAERAAIVSCVEAVAGRHEGAGMTDDIARRVLKKEAQWDEWADYSFSALDDVKEALGVIRVHGTESDLKDYKGALIEVAVTVAQAFGEFGDHGASDEGGFKALLGKITSRFVGADDAGHPMNISAVEDDCINQLKTILKDY